MTESGGRSGQKEFHGCMSAILHLFDFNHALTPPKILPQGFSEEVEGPKNCAEKASGVVMCGSDNGEKKRMPNVVARLMGLDLMSKDSTSVDQSRNNSVSTKQSLGISMEKKPLTLSKSRSVNTLSETSDHLLPNLESASHKFQFRSQSFREHPQEKRLQEFKREFEATQLLHSQHGNVLVDHKSIQQRPFDASERLLKDKLIDSKRTPACKRQNQASEFLDALQYLQKNEEIFLRALRDPNSYMPRKVHPLNPQYTRKASSQELSSPRLHCLVKNHNEAIPLHSRPESNSKKSVNVNSQLPKIVVLKPNSGYARQSNGHLRSYKGEPKQSGNVKSAELRNGREIPEKRVKHLKENCIRKVSEEKSRGRIFSRASTTSTSSSNGSSKGENVFSNTCKISSRPAHSTSGLQSLPRVRKDMAQNNDKEDRASARKQSECVRSSDKRKISSKPCSVPRHNRDAHDRLAAGYPSSSKSTADSPKKRLHQQNLMSKKKHQNGKSDSVLTDEQDRKTGENGNAQIITPNDVLINSEDETEGNFHECPVDVACQQVLGDIGDKCEFPSPVSVLDGPFQHDSPIPSPINIKEIATNFHELRTKLCSLELNSDDTRDPDQYGHVHHESTLEVSPEDILLTPRTEVLSDKRSHPFEKQTSIFESLNVDDIVCPKGKRGNLWYVRNVLVCAGFNDDNILAFTRWHSPSHPLDPQVFYRLEEYYHDVKTNNTCMNSTSGSQACEESTDEVNRKLLFELVDEILCKRIKPFLKIRAWINPAKRNLRYMSTGKQLLKEVWEEICRCPEADCEILEDVESLVHRDMASEAPWAGDDEDIEKVGFEVEQHIFDYLLQEAVFDLLSV